MELFLLLLLLMIILTSLVFVIQSGYDWLTLTGPVSSHNITVPDLDQAQSDFRFGVSMEQDGVSSGIAWSSCLYDRPSGTVSAHLSVPQLQACLTNAGCGSNWVACVCP